MILKICSYSTFKKSSTISQRQTRLVFTKAVKHVDKNLVIKNRVGDLQLGIESYQTKINLERPNWDAADYYFKEDYNALSSQDLDILKMEMEMEIHSSSTDINSDVNRVITKVEAKLLIMWECGLGTQSNIQFNMLKRLRFKYATKILLIELNVQAKDDV
ncbi:hypothetical protein Tco_0842078 [Tanacetum coccineum]|uniref:Uncharacterized protein n=1 Tax=Tanacetum coccineum TaxID=301880 RepID=A0ABQ5AZ65_9ASTR